MKKIATITTALVLALSLTACGSSGGEVTESGTSDAAAQSEEATPTEEKPANPTFGDTYTWDNGLAVTISQPEEIELSSEFSAELYDLTVGPVLVFDITVHNGTTEEVEAMAINTQMTSGGKQSEAVFAGEDGIEMPTVTILPDNDLSWKIAFVVADPENLQLSVSNILDFDTDEVHFTN